VEEPVDEDIFLRQACSSSLPKRSSSPRQPASRIPGPSEPS
jgi:hypothetical protein